MTSKGQITVPADVRAALNLRPGDKVEFVVSDDRVVRFVAINLPLEALVGSVRYDGPPVSIAEMKDDIAEAAVDGEAPRKRRVKRAA